VTNIMVKEHLKINSFKHPMNTSSTVNCYAVLVMFNYGLLNTGSHNKGLFYICTHLVVRDKETKKVREIQLETKHPD
jgi:hypothetical protein